ncbi:helix-turn-helix domain-containing protein [Fictibacillus sp. NRS-1165]|uniref:helix-turn-helix domain-containing protein n=1 Tax=Fictibacillus sp. NRS-1165 TaxID=3144463 RepID=UPI003D214432
MIGTLVKKYREEKGLSLSNLAQRSDIAKSYLSMLERNIQTNPSVQVLEKIAYVLDIPIEKLLHDTTKVNMDELDNEWAALVKQAMKSGVSKSQFKEYLEFNKWRNAQK